MITNGGDQPNVVPPNAAVWYYFREADYDHIMNLWRIGDNMAKAAGLMTDTDFTEQLLGAHGPDTSANRSRKRSMRISRRSACQNGRMTTRRWPKRFRRTKQPVRGFVTKIVRCRPSRASGGRGRGRRFGAQQPMGGGSDDIGDVSWAVPTVTLSFPSNIPGGPGHNWANGISMATPIAHKGVVAGAKVQAMTILDILTHPELVQAAKDYFNNVQNKDMKYTTFLRPDDKPAIWLNEKTMANYRDRMKQFYYDPESTIRTWSSSESSTRQFELPVQTR